jgi:hypothetical protein
MLVLEEAAARPKLAFPPATLFAVALEAGAEKFGFTPPFVAELEAPPLLFVDLEASFLTLLAMSGFVVGFRVVGLRLAWGAGLSSSFLLQLLIPIIRSPISTIKLDFNFTITVQVICFFSFSPLKRNI